MPEKSLKTLVFEKSDTQQFTMVDCQFDLTSKWVDISSYLEEHCPLNQFTVSIYEPIDFKFVLLTKLATQAGLIPTYILEPSVIMLRFTQKGQSSVDSEEIRTFNWQSSYRSFEQRQGRSKPRTIGQVIQIVKKWRDLHLHGHTFLKKRLNLQEAAKVVGIPKKSLDDYYCQLRLGELYQFNFSAHLHEKMRVLRNFIKDYKPEKSEHSVRKQNEKHPKSLKIIHYYDLESHNLKKIQEPNPSQAPTTHSSDSQKTQAQQNEPKKEQQMEVKNQSQVELVQETPVMMKGESAIVKEMFEVDNIYQHVDIPLGIEGDPCYELDRDIRKKDSYFESNSCMIPE